MERVERIDRWQCRRQPLFLVFFYEGRHRGCDNEFVSAATPSGLAPLPVTDRRRPRGPGCDRLARCDHDGCHFRLLGSRYCVFAILSLRGFYSVRGPSPFSVGWRHASVGTFVGLDYYVPFGHCICQPSLPKRCPSSGVAVAPARRWQRKITDRNPSQPPPLFTQLPGGALPATNIGLLTPYHLYPRVGPKGGCRALRVVACDALACCPGSLPKEGLWSLLSEPCLA